MFTNSLVLNEEQSTNAKEELIDSPNYLFNSIDQTVSQASANDEIFSDIDSLITLYDFDILPSLDNNNQTSTKLDSSEQINLNKLELGETKCSINQDSSNDTLNGDNLFTMDSAIGLSPINSSLNSSLNSSATSCSTSASVNSSSTSFASNQANNTISPVIS